MSNCVKFESKNVQNEIDDDYVDPRVQVELEQLNNATDAINRLEVELDETRAAYRHFLTESSHKFKFLASRLGNCIEKAQPYYAARLRAKEAHVATQDAAMRFEKANGAHCAAKEMVFHAEEGLVEHGMPFDSTWQEMLNHATEKVNQAERERASSKALHRKLSGAYVEAEKEVQMLQKRLKNAISKSNLSTRRSLLQFNSLAYRQRLLHLPYYEIKAEFNELMEKQKLKVQRLEKEICSVKQSYSDALNNLEEISIEIHKQRELKGERRVLGSRESGVGAESPKVGAHDVPVPPHDYDVYLTLPFKPPTKKPPTQVQDTITRVDNACQTENLDMTAPIISDHKHQSDRISAWVRESGLRMMAAARSASLRSGPDAAHAGTIADMLLNATEESDRSDVESLNSTDVLTDEQISHLMLDKDLDDVYPEFAKREKTGNDAEELKTPDSVVRSDVSGSSVSKATSCNADTSGSSVGKSSSEFKVVAVEFTVHETLVTPKMARKSSKSESK